MKRNPELKSEEIDETLLNIRRLLLKEEEPGIFVRYIIAEIIEDIFGINERGVYFCNVFYKNI